MSKVFRIEETEHRVHQYDVYADSIDDAAERFPAAKADCSGYFVRVCEDNGSIRIEEIPQESSVQSVPIASIVEETIHYDQAGRQCGTTRIFRQEKP